MRGPQYLRVMGPYNTLYNIFLILAVLAEDFYLLAFMTKQLPTAHLKYPWIINPLPHGNAIHTRAAGNNRPSKKTIVAGNPCLPPHILPSTCI